MTRILLRSLIVAAAAVTSWQFSTTNIATAQEPTPANSDDADSDDSPDAASEEADDSDSDAPYYQDARVGGGPVLYAPQTALFQNYYAVPGYPASMYPAPIPTPPIVGHVYYTNPAVMPHEMLYSHYRVYYNVYGNYHSYGGLRGFASYNKTQVRYGRGGLMSTYFARQHPPATPGIPTYRPGRGPGNVYGSGNCQNCQQ